jgi:hypothetical protein
VSTVFAARGPRRSRRGRAAVGYRRPSYGHREATGAAWVLVAVVWWIVDAACPERGFKETGSVQVTA